MNKAIKYRLYPNKQQEELLIKTFGCCRKIWNLMLSDKIEYYKETGKMLQTTPAQYKKQEQYNYLKEVDSLALANTQLQLQNAYKNFFRRVKQNSKKSGFPKFKSAKHSKNSYTTNNQKGTIAIFDKGIKLPKIGKIKAKIHRRPKIDWIIKSATVSQDSDKKFYVSILFEFEQKVDFISKSSDSIIGLDYKSDGLYMDSNGNIGTNHKYYRESHKKLAKAQRKLKHKIIGSNNYKKQQQKIAKIHKHIANQRSDNLHKISTEIANQYDVICVESLNMRAMANKGFGNGKATMDNGYGMFLNMLQYKLNDRGKYLVKVDKWYPSSQLCSCCGGRKKLTVNERVYKCDNCGLIIDRDYNASLNIKNEGLRILEELI